jgi:hypothetical protein
MFPMYLSFTEDPGHQLQANKEDLELASQINFKVTKGQSSVSFYNKEH